jgi:hypothetical protein
MRITPEQVRAARALPRIDQAKLAAQAAYPTRAALIRRHGGVPDNESFGPPEPHIVKGLLASRQADRNMRSNR